MSEGFICTTHIRWCMAECHGVVKMNPLGPHFYVSVESGEKPTGMVDVLTDRMNELLSVVAADSGREVTHEHIRGHEPITHVSWDADGSISVECPALSETWYSAEPIHNY